jgi:hypothetical protein
MEVGTVEKALLNGLLSYHCIVVMWEQNTLYQVRVELEKLRPAAQNWIAPRFPLTLFTTQAVVIFLLLPKSEVGA